MTMVPGHKIEILGEGHVMYLDHLGTDTRIAEAARASYGKPSQGKEKDEKLIKYLFLNRHTSPFEQCNITFEIKMPIFVMRQFVRHRTSRLNEYSGRYAELPDTFYIPAVWRRQQTEGNKQGSVFEYDREWNEENECIAQSAFAGAYEAYQKLLARGVAKELARIVLPLATFTQIHVNIDLHNLLHMFYLRTDSHAQLEYQELAKAMVAIASTLYPVTTTLFRQYVPKMVERVEPYDEEIWVTHGKKHE